MIKEQIYLNPKTLEQAAVEAKKYADCFRFVAGGTDVIVNKFQGNENSKVLIDLTGISELKQVVTKENHIEIGSLVCLNDLKNHKIISEKFPALIEAANSVASPVIRKTATLGGNLLCENRCVFYNQTEWWRTAAGSCLKSKGEICHATGGKNNCLSKFVSDTAVVLISMNAGLEIVDNNQTSIVALESIYTGDGINPCRLSKSAIIRSVYISTRDNFKVIYKKLRQRESIDFTSLSTAVSINKNDKIKIVIAGVDPKPILIEGKKTDILSELSTNASKQARTVDNDVFPRKYRKEMIPVFLEKSFQELQLK